MKPELTVHDGGGAPAPRGARERVLAGLTHAMRAAAALLGAKGGVFIAFWGADGHVETIGTDERASARVRTHLLREADAGAKDDPIPPLPTEREIAGGASFAAMVREAMRVHPNNLPRAMAEARARWTKERGKQP